MCRRRYHVALLFMLLVSSGAAEAPQTTPGLAYASGDPAIDALQAKFHSTLEANRISFQGATGRVEGFGAGASYPQLWLRDSATLLPLARWYYGRAVLVGWLEEHLAHQRGDGALFDWIAGGPAAGFKEWAPRAEDVFVSATATVSADKNTTEADQETSAIDAAWRFWRATGDAAWLRKEVRGRSVLDRLQRAARQLFAQRLDPNTGLIANALTADWGDVSPLYPDQRAIYADARTPRVVGIYTNALAYRAARQLTEMAGASGDGVSASYWRTKAPSLRDAALRGLWQKARGFFRVHVPLPPRPGPFGDSYAWPLPDALRDEAGGRFALGGNVMAVLAGLVDGERAQRILSAAETSRIEGGFAAPGAVLFPPFPRDAFRHPVMRDPWRYQNGGAWDWFAGRLVLAEFQAGRSRLARRHLSAIARRARDAGGLFEWYDRAGGGRGSPRYAGSAAALGQAVVEGLFGVDLAGGQLNVTLRLDRSGWIRLEEAATSTELRVALEVDAAHLQVELDTNASPGRLAVVLPEGTRVTAVLRGTEQVDFAVAAHGEDRFVLLRATRHDRLTIRLAGR